MALPGRHRVAPKESSNNERRGAVTVWTLLLVAVLVSMLAVAVEVGHIWLARAELENAMEAAALAAVQEWASDPNDPQKTLPARLMGVEYATANTVTGTQWNVPGGTPFTTNRDSANLPNENASCAGNLIFGAVSLAPPFTFRAGTAPQCEHYEHFGEVGLDLEITTQGSDTNYRRLGSFRLTFMGVPHPPTGAYITKITWKLQSQAGASGQFDVNTLSPALTENLVNVAREGWGPYFLTGPDRVVPTTVTPDGTAPGQSPMLEMTFSPGSFGPGQEVVFGVDTDMVGLDNQSPLIDTADRGGYFKDALADFTILIEFNSGATAIISGSDSEVNGTKDRTFTPNGLVKDLFIWIPATGEFGVRAQATATIKPVFSAFCLPLGPFSVQTQATARAGCSSPRPQLIRVESYFCP